jgi:uncharacterized caspase-like protein
MPGRSFAKAVFAAAFSIMLAGAAAAQSRIALVIGNSAYRNAAPLATVAGDASIVAETMRAAGYDVIEARDVQLADIGYALRDFLDKVAAAGPQAVAYVYYAGYAAQSHGENFLVPVDAQIGGDEDVQYQALRIGDLIRELMALPAAARLIVLDASRNHGFGRGGPSPVSQGLALMDVPDGLLVASAAAPGALAIDGDGPFSIYTTALVTFMRQPGLDMEQIFKAARVQVNQLTNGRQTPWMASSLTVDLRLFDAPAAASAAPPQQVAGVAIPPKGDRVLSKDELRRLGPEQAYQAVIEEDGLEFYQWFVELYPESEHAAQIWKIINDRREAVLWRRTLAQGTRNAFWNYLKRYPDGEHAAEAGNRLEALSAQRRPPAAYTPVPEPLPPDYYDEAIGLYEVYPNDIVSPVIAVFEAIAPLFIAPPRRRDFGFGPVRRPPPPPPPPQRTDRTGTPVITQRDPNTTRGDRGTRGVRGDRGTRPITTPGAPQTGTQIGTPTGRPDGRPTTTQTPTGRPDGRPVTSQTGRTTPVIPQTGGRPTTTTAPATPVIPQTGGRTTPTTTPAIPPSGGRPTTTTTPAIPPTGGRPAPGTPPTGVSPTIPAAPQTGSRPAPPTIPGVPQTGGRPTPATTPAIPPSGGRPTTTTTPAIPPTGGRPAPGTPPTGVSPTIPAAPQTGSRPTTPTIPGVPQTGGRPTTTTAPAIPPIGGRPAPGAPQTGSRPSTPTIPSVPQTGGRPTPPTAAPTIPSVPQTGGRPTPPSTPATPGIRPGTTPSTPPTPVTPVPTSPRPGLPPATGARPTLPPSSGTRPTPPPTATQKPGLPPQQAQPPSRPTAPPTRVTPPASPPRVSAPPPRPTAPPPRVSAPPRPAAPPPRVSAPPPRPVAPPPRVSAPPPRPAAPPPRPACPPGKRC